MLDEALIEFGSALENLDYDRAISILEPLQTTPETEAMWRQVVNLPLVQWLSVVEGSHLLTM